jgi:hypothetical protein
MKYTGTHENDFTTHGSSVTIPLDDLLVVEEARVPHDHLRRARASVRAIVGLDKGDAGIKLGVDVRVIKVMISIETRSKIHTITAVS